MEKFVAEQGNVVALKSGGPWMTIRSIEDNGNVHLVYFDEVNREFIYYTRNGHDFATTYKRISE